MPLSSKYPDIFLIKRLNPKSMLVCILSLSPYNELKPHKTSTIGTLPLLRSLHIRPRNKRFILVANLKVGKRQMMQCPEMSSPRPSTQS